MTLVSTRKPQATGLPFMALLAGGVAVGLSPVFVRLSDVGPLASGFFRLALALPVLWLIQALTPEPATIAAKPDARDRALLVLTGAIFGIDIICWHMALTHTSVADATLISNTAPIMVAIGAVFLFKEHMKPLFMVGLGLAITGVASLALQKAGGVEPPNRLIGDGFAIGAAISYAIYLLMVAHLRKRHGTQRIVMYTTVFAGFVMLPTALIFSPAMLPVSLNGWLILLALALISHIGGQVFMTYALAHLPASFSSLTQLMQAVVAAIAAWAILNEPLTAMKLVSGAAILIGIYLCGRAATARA